MEELAKNLERLKLRDEGGTVEGSLDKILRALAVQDKEHVSVCRILVDGGILPELYYLLTTKTENQDKIAELVAEVAKVESHRGLCVSQGLIPPLLNLLTHEKIAVCTQACRALGNICFDNDVGRGEVDEHDGVARLIDLLKSHLRSSADGSDRLRMIACGFLLNLTNTNESMQEKAIHHSALEVLDEYLQVHSSDESTCQMALMSIGSLAESEVGKEKLAESELVLTVIKLLDTEAGEDLLDTILELLATLAEIDDLKVKMSQSNLKEHLIKVLHAHSGQNEDEDKLMEKLSSDLIVLLLTGDGSMEALYEGGEGLIFQESLKWLQSDSEHLRTSGALAIGNFARNDDHCIKLVQDKNITEALLGLLEEPEGTEVCVTLQHAVLSALRNLAIPAGNKPVMLERGVIDKVLLLSHSEVAPVQFKLLGLLRMIIDGQVEAAKKLGSNSEFMSRLITWCSVEDHAGVKGEATRLLAWLIKHSRYSEVMKVIVNVGGIPHLVAMATSEHAVMQNEALIALTIIASTVLDVASASLDDSDYISTLQQLLGNQNTLTEILCNTFTLVQALAKSDDLKSKMFEARIEKYVSNLTDHDDAMVKTQALTLGAVLGKG